MLRIASAQVEVGAEALGDRLAAALLHRLGGAPTRAVVFFVRSELGPGLAGIEGTLRERTGAEAVIGCTAARVFDAESGAEDGPLASALAIAGDVEVRRVFCAGLRGRAEDVGRELGRAVQAVSARPRALFVLADSYNLAPDELLAGCETIAPGTLVCGAGASEDGATGETAVVGRGTSSANALGGLAVGGMRLRTLVIPATTLVGPWWPVTRAEGNRALELGRRPAIEVFLEALPSALREDVPTALRATLAAIREPGAPADAAYLARPVVALDPKAGAVAIGDEIYPGMELALVVRDPSRTAEELERRLATFAASCGRLAGALYVVTGERGSAGFGIPGLEAAYLRRHLGDRPIAGFYCGAAIAPLGDRNRFHQHAGVLIGFEED